MRVLLTGKKTNSRATAALLMLITCWMLPAHAAEAGAATTQPALLGSRVIDWEKLPVRASKAGSRRGLFNSPTASLTRFEGHVTTLNPGVIAHAPHRHPHEEVFIIKEGTVEVSINGEPHRIGAGSVVFIASNDLHNVRNVGEGSATYHVITFASAATAALPGK